MLFRSDKIAAYLVEFAGKHGLEAKTDAIGNVLIKKPAFPGRESSPIVVLQSTRIGDNMRYLPMGYFNKNSLGEISSTMTNTLDDVQNVGNNYR